MQMGNNKRDTKRKEKNPFQILQVTLLYYFHHPSPHDAVRLSEKRPELY